jgi:hypothetical protein
MQSEATGRAGDLTNGDGQRARRGFGRLLRHDGVQAEPVLGVLPVRRVIPQDIHSILDYSNGILVAWSGLTSRKRKARIAGTVLGASIVSVSLLTDYRLSVAKLIPIEVHEALDYVWSAAVIAAPFAFGYQRRAPLTTLAHVLTGAATILGSLFTDYRAERGVGRRLAQRMMGEGRSRRVDEPTFEPPSGGV